MRPSGRWGRFERPRAHHDLDVDVCVIGGGLAGLTAAREVARRGWSVAVLEARPRRLERVRPQRRLRAAGLRATGSARHRRARRHRPRQGAVGAVARPASTMCARPSAKPRCPASTRSTAGSTCRRSTMSDGLLRGREPARPGVRRDRRGLADRAGARGARRATLFPGHALSRPRSTSIRSTMRSASPRRRDAAGARIFEDTPALAIDPAGVRKRITTPNGRVRAAPRRARGQRASRRAGAAASPKPCCRSRATWRSRRRSASAWPRRCAIPARSADTRRADDHYRIVGGDRLMWGGRVTTRLSEPRRLGCAAAPRPARASIPQLGEVEIEHAWSGMMGYAVHKMPQIGELSPGSVARRARSAAHGLNTTAMAGELIARAIVERDDRWRLFSSYELVWAGGKVGPPAAQAITWSMQVRDTIEERLSHRREAARLRAAAAAVRRNLPVTAERPAFTAQPTDEEAAQQIADAPPRLEPPRRTISSPRASRARRGASRTRERGRCRPCLRRRGAGGAGDRAGVRRSARARGSGLGAAGRGRTGRRAGCRRLAPPSCAPDAASMTIGDFSPQYIAPAEATASAAEPMTAAEVDAAPPRRRRRPRAED